MVDNKKRKQPEPAQKQEQAKDTQGTVPFEEQMMRRQSAPRPTAADGMRQMQQSPRYQGMNAHTMAVDEPVTTQPAAMAPGVANGFQALNAVIGREQILQAQLTLTSKFLLTS